MTDAGVEKDEVDLGGGSSEPPDDEPGVDCGEIWGSSKLDLLRGSAKLITFFIVFMSSGTSIYSKLIKKNDYQNGLYIG